MHVSAATAEEHNAGSSCLPTHDVVCAVSTVPDCVRFMQTLQVTSPAKDFLTSLRRYPNMRSEVEVNMRSLRSALGNVYRAAHGVCERLVKLKVSHLLHTQSAGC